METKKTKKADLENKRNLFGQIGLVIVLGLTLMAFEWKFYGESGIDLGCNNTSIVDDDVIFNKPVDIPKPEPPKIAQSQILKIVTNNVITNEMPLFNPEDTPDDIADTYAIPAIIKEDEPVDKDEPFVWVESFPEFSGGDLARLSYLKNNLVYPELARSVGIQGTVHLSFIIEKDGSITHIKVERGIGGGCDEEAIRVLDNMPRWIPGKQRDVPVRVKMSIAIKFTLAN